jgi:hypothetical protein
METITEAYVDSLAVNSSAMKNGKDLAKKKSYSALHKSSDGTLLFGDCKGSGKEPYRCSVDWIKPDSPVFRCTCPSRQFPCKHILGLLYAFTQGQPFTEAEAPADIAEKREKAAAKEKKAAADPAESDPPNPAAAEKRAKASKAALAKKLAAQLEGIALLDKLILQITQMGLSSLDGRAVKQLEAQAKQLGNSYIPGAQSAVRRLLLLLGRDTDREALYTRAMDQLTTLHTLVKKARAHLTARVEDPELPMDTESTIEEWLGHAWQLSELKSLGRSRQDAEMAQLAFWSYTDEARGEYVDEGFWMELASGELLTTRNYRPFRAAKSMKEDDSCFSIVQAKETFVYPGEWTPRVRWEEYTFRKLDSQDLERIVSVARSSYADTLKAVKAYIKNPLAGKYPAALLQVADIVRIEEQYVIRDSAGAGITLGSIGELPEDTIRLLTLIPYEELQGSALLVMFGHNLDTGALRAQPLSLFTRHKQIRLLY